MLLRLERLNLDAEFNANHLQNAFYSFEPPSEDYLDGINSDKWVNLCIVYGCSADKICGMCELM